jgi:hypothetical protein
MYLYLYKVLLTKYHWGNQVKKTEMGRTCGTYGGEERCIQGFRRIFGPKRDEVTGEWRRLHNKELYALYSSPNIIRVMKSRRLRWTGHVTRMGERIGFNGETRGKGTTWKI